MDVLSHVVTIIICLLAFLSGWFAIISIVEKERRAVLVAALLCLILLALALLWQFSLFHGKEIIAVVFAFLLAFSLIFLVIPVRSSDKFPRSRINRIDERDIQFSRYYLTPDQKKEYYKRHPEKKKIDDQFHELPGILSDHSSQYHPLFFASAEATTEMIEALRFKVDGPVAPQQDQIPPTPFQSDIRRQAKRMGALETGFCQLKPEHFYHTRGRHQYYGDAVESTHTHAIVFAVEMDRSFISTAPQAPVVLESYKRYLEAGLIAIQVAEFLRHLGWGARAHIDSNYEVICSLVARDAGMGEIGRMGILMNKKTGPRCRLSVVTTTIPFEPFTAATDPNILHFCGICKKCAQCCPAQAISDQPYSQDPKTTGWKIDSDKCFSYWLKAGTDCARCMAVCPFSHDNSLLHRLIRKGISNSKLFARVALWMDDIFYGKRPKSKKIQTWMTG